MVGMLGAPFGGPKHNGYGREHAIQTLQDFGYTKMIRIPAAPAPSPRGAASPRSSTGPGDLVYPIP
jgi:hypothetical protein